ncbi:MAG TPA: SurA N-terminal domain-containing protein [Desulfopila sp.]|nr:SurA N-terminal domain-containing protein [Desulfopila sp.]
MLQILRNKAQSIVIQAIVVIIALVFIFWGVGTNLMNNREAAIVVNDEEITFQDYQQAYDRAYENIRAQFGGDIPPGLAENLGIKQQVTNQLVQEALLRQGAAEMGIHVSAEEVRRTLKNMVQFQEDGAFSMEKYTSLLAANGFTPTSFEESIRYDMLAQKARLNIGEFATTVTDYEIKDLYRLEKSEIAVRYVTIETGEYADSVTVDEEKLQEWFAGVEDRYKTAPQVKLRYLDFSYENVGSKIAVDGDSIAQYYWDNIGDFTSQERRKARHILFAVDENSAEEVHAEKRQKAQEIMEMARQGSDFAELARQYSEGPSKAQGGELGFFSRGQMVAPFEEAAFRLEQGEISDVVKTDFGYHIIKIEEIIPKSTRSLEEVSEIIKEQLQIEQARPLAFQVANEAYEGIISAGSLDAYLETTPGVDAKITDFFSRNDPPPPFTGDNKFLQAAFSLKQGELSSLVETSQGYAILMAEAIKEPQVPEMSDVRERVEADYKAERANTLAEETAQSLLDKARELEGLRPAAEKGGFTVKHSEYLSKGSTGESGIPPGLIDGAFKLSPSTPLPQEPLQADGSYFVYEFVDKKIPQKELAPEERNRYKNAILQLKQQQILSGWLESQHRQAEVFTHQRL